MHNAVGSGAETISQQKIKLFEFMCLKSHQAT